MAEMKLSLARFVSTYRVSEAPGGRTRLDGRKGDPFFFSYPEVNVKLEWREKEEQEKEEEVCEA